MNAEDKINQISEAKTFTQLKKALDQAREDSQFSQQLKVGVASNVMVEPIQYFLQKHCFLNQIDCEVILGEYDNPVQNSQKFVDEKVDVIVLDYLFDNLKPFFESSFSQLSEQELELVIEKFSNELNLVFAQAKNISYVFVNRLFPIFQNRSNAYSEEVHFLAERFNQVLEETAKDFKNVVLLHSQNIFNTMGAERAIDFRYYYQFKSPWKFEFWDEYARDIVMSTRAKQTFFNKVLVLDCDNTLWGGVVGEDLLEGIKLSPFSYPGNIFWQVQNEFLQLQKYGVLLCLCSKNNPQDVDQVLQEHEFQVIKDEHVVVKKVNWRSKVENIQELAEELSLGLDSFVFIDDSDFEVESVKSMLPAVKVFQVPKKLGEYRSLVEEIKQAFLSGGVSKESQKKTLQYKQRALVNQERGKHQSFEEYLKALQIKVELDLNNSSQAKRIAELTQKSNQFNLTTRRYTEPEILQIMNSQDQDVFSISVEDKFGSSGLTGVVIVNKKNQEVEVDSFLMSCRVIGREIENYIWKDILKYYSDQSIAKVKSLYLKTRKNDLVKDFYANLGFEEVGNKNDENKEYETNIESFLQKYKTRELIEVSFEHK